MTKKGASLRPNEKEIQHAVVTTPRATLCADGSGEGDSTPRARAHEGRRLTKSVDAMLTV